MLKHLIILLLLLSQTFFQAYACYAIPTKSQDIKMQDKIVRYLEISYKKLPEQEVIYWYVALLHVKYQELIEENYACILAKINQITDKDQAREVMEVALCSAQENNVWHTILENIKSRIPEQIRQQCDALEQRCLHEIKALKIDDMFIGLTNWILEDIHEKILELLTKHYTIDRAWLGLSPAIALPEDGWVTRMIGFLSFD